MTRRRLAVLTGVAGTAILAGSVSLAAAESPERPASTETVATIDVETTTVEPSMDGMDHEMIDDGDMDMGRDLESGGGMSGMHDEMMIAMHEAMMGGSMNRDMGRMVGVMVAACEEMMSGD